MQNELQVPIISKLIHKDTSLRRILVEIFYEVFLGLFKDIFKAVYGFLKTYVVLILYYLKFIVDPDASDILTHRKKGIENSKHTFELLGILTAVIIFLIKQDYLESYELDSLTYGFDGVDSQNDIEQWVMEFKYFIAYAVCYFPVLCLLVLLGRLLRMIFSPIQPGVVMDLVFIHLNNVFFLIAAISSFIVRLNMSASELRIVDKYDMQHYLIQLFNSFGIVFGIILLVFFIRLTMLHKISFIKKVIYIIIIPAIVWTFLFFMEVVISMLMSFF